MEKLDEHAGITLAGSEAIRYVVEESARLVETRLQASQLRWRAFVGSALALLAFLGYTRLGDLVGGTISEKVAALFKTYSETTGKAMIDAGIGDRLQAVHEELQTELASLQFSSLSDELNKRESFNQGERDAAVSLLERIRTSRVIVKRPEFKTALEHLLDAFNDAGLAGEIDQIDDVLGDIAVSTKGMVQTLVIHYGTRVLDEPEISASTYARFRKYTVAARDRYRQPDLSLPYELAVAYRQAGDRRSKLTRELIRDIRHLDAKQKARVLAMIIVSSSGQSRSADTFRELRVAHGRELEGMFRDASVLASFRELEAQNEGLKRAASESVGPRSRDDEREMDESPPASRLHRRQRGESM